MFRKAAPLSVTVFVAAHMGCQPDPTSSPTRQEGPSDEDDAQSSTGGRAVGGDAGTGDPDGGAPSGGPGGAPGDQPIVATLDELLEMPCVVSRDESSDGSVESYWGVEYDRANPVRQIVAHADEALRVIEYSEGRPVLVCEPDSCDVIAKAEVPIDERCSSYSTTGSDGYLVTNRPNPPTLPLDKPADEYAVAHWLLHNNQPVQISREGLSRDGDPTTSGRLHCFDGETLRYASNFSRSDYDGDSYSSRYFPDGKLQRAETFDHYHIIETCYESGWQAAFVIDDKYVLRTLLQLEDGRPIGATTHEDWIDHGGLSVEDYTSTFEYSDDSLSVEVLRIRESDGEETIRTWDLGQPSRTREYDDEGNLMAEVWDLDGDGQADRRDSYGRSSGCQDGDNPPLETVPSTSYSYVRPRSCERFLGESY